MEIVGLFVFRLLFIVALLWMLYFVLSLIYFGNIEQYRVALYGDGKYYIERRESINRWEKSCYYFSYESENGALKQIDKIFKQKEDERKAKTRIKIIKHVPKTLAQSKLSDLVKAVNEGRKEDEERIFSEISGYFNG